MKSISIALAIALSWLVCQSCASAGAFSFTPVVDTSTMVPGQSTTFTSFANGPPSLEGSDFAFIGEFNGGFGWYKDVGGNLTKVADTSTVIPGDPAAHNFDILSAGQISFSRGEVAFASGRIAGGLLRGIYTDIGGTLDVFADTNLDIPGTRHEFFAFVLFPSIDNGNIVFAGGSSGTTRGIYTNLGGNLHVVDSNSSSQNYGGTAIDSGNIAYNFPQNMGIRAQIGGVVLPISATGLEPAISGTNIAYVGSSFHAIDADFGGGIVADTSTNVPGGNGTFQSLSDVSLSGSAVTFLGVDAIDRAGLYTTLGGKLQKVIAEGDTVDGHTVSQLFSSGEALSGQTIAFAANFTDGSQAIYLATYQLPLIGDYNGNGIVDAADYTIWRDTLGSTIDLRANGDNTGASAGVIDHADYVIWKSNFGSHSGSGSSAGSNAAVPEPATLQMLMAGILTLCSRRLTSVS
jgi:hypothetical protein